MRRLRPRAAAAAAVSLALLCGCSAEEAPDRQAVPPASAAAGQGHGASIHGGDSERVVNVYSWADYIAPDTVANFEKETGITVHYDVFDNNEVLETKLLTGHSNYDVVVPTGAFFARQLEAGVYRPLDKRSLPNLANTDPEIMRRMAVYDPGNRFAVPYMWSTTGLGYNIDMVRARLGDSVPDSWSLLFDARNAAKLEDCGILLIDSPLEVFESALIYLHRDPNRHDAQDLAAAAEVLGRIRRFVRNIDPAPIAPLANGEVCLVLGWSGDMEAARSRAGEAGSGVRIAYLIPREGAMTSVDMIAIPEQAPHPRNAEIWMNYLLRPEVIAAISNYVKYPNGNAASLALIDPALRNDPAVYPDAATRARLVTETAAPLNYSRLVTRAWRRFRTAQ